MFSMMGGDGYRASLYTSSKRIAEREALRKKHTAEGERRVKALRALEAQRQTAAKARQLSTPSLLQRTFGAVKRVFSSRKAAALLLGTLAVAASACSSPVEPTVPTGAPLGCYNEPSPVCAVNETRLCGVCSCLCVRN